MSAGYLDRERFWIALTIRVAFGLMFLIAALNIFTYPKTADKPLPTKYLQNVNAFAADLKQPYQQSWANIKWPWGKKMETDPTTRETVDVGIICIEWFLLAMPFIFACLAFCLLTGLFLFPALRFSAVYLVILGLGKYIVNDSATTAQDFIYAGFILVGLYMASGRKDSRYVETMELES